MQARQRKLLEGAEAARQVEEAALRCREEEEARRAAARRVELANPKPKPEPKPHPKLNPSPKP